ncbi:MAG: DegT/DnrJ/EryC1/StrS family aminotransferase [Geodermatophilaceae bacterium]
MSSIPLVDLAASHAQVRTEVLAGFDQVLAETAFIGGKQVAEFERAYADFLGVRHCVGVGNGTDALELALRALQVGPGDECVVPANTFIATAEAVVRTGATPILVDCRADTFLMDVEHLEAVVGERTKVIIPVHLYGQAAPVEDIVKVADWVGARVLEDAAQSQGARQGDRAAGALADISATSFYPGKNLGAYGDAGAVMTDDESLAQAVRLLGAHGSPAKYQHPVLGFNSRMDTLQAVVLNAKLARLASWNEARRRAAGRYHELLSTLDSVVLPVTAPDNVHVWHLYVVRVPHRDDVLSALHTEGIGAGIHYPTPVHLTGAFEYLGHHLGDFPVAEQTAGELLSLPLFPEITEDQQTRVVSALRTALAS